MRRTPQSPSTLAIRTFSSTENAVELILQAIAEELVLDQRFWVLVRRHLPGSALYNEPVRSTYPLASFCSTARGRAAQPQPEIRCLVVYVVVRCDNHGAWRTASSSRAFSNGPSLPNRLSGDRSSLARKWLAVPRSRRCGEGALLTIRSKLPKGSSCGHGAATDIIPAHAFVARRIISTICVRSASCRSLLAKSTPNIFEKVGRLDTLKKHTALICQCKSKGEIPARKAPLSTPRLYTFSTRRIASEFRS